MMSCRDADIVDVILNVGLITLSILILHYNSLCFIASEIKHEKEGEKSPTQKVSLPLSLSLHSFIYHLLNFWKRQSQKTEPFVFSPQNSHHQRIFGGKSDYHRIWGNHRPSLFYPNQQSYLSIDLQHPFYCSFCSAIFLSNFVSGFSISTSIFSWAGSTSLYACLNLRFLFDFYFFRGFGPDYLIVLIYV